MHDSLVKALSRVHGAIYRLSGGNVGTRLVDNDMLLLSTIGRSTGRTHTVPLLYLEDEDGYVVIASYGGRPQHPEWYRNLLEEPSAEVIIGSARTSVVAETMTDVERAVWWPRIVESYSGYAIYQSRTDRIIPVVRLSIHGS
jgi:deazaflavin-dependent oxidoreductase (nitroreductase family)